MKILSTSINQNASFQALNITPEAKAVIEKWPGGKEKLEKYAKELANHKFDLNIKADKKGLLYSLYGDNRIGPMSISRIDKDMIMVVTRSNFEYPPDYEVVDCLKFSSPKRAQEIYEEYFIRRSKCIGLERDVFAMKVFNEAEFVPQRRSPWKDFLSPKDSGAIIPMKNQKKEKYSFWQKVKNFFNFS